MVARGTSGTPVQKWGRNTPAWIVRAAYTWRAILEPRLESVTTFGKRMVGLWALCILLLSWSTEAMGVHACPHHARIGTAAVAAEAHGHHGAPGRAPAEHDEHRGCTCASGCPASGYAPLARTGDAVGAPLGIDGDASIAPASGDTPRLHSEPFFLPYGQAPPSVS
jgi:hypothetical protein